MLTAAAPGAIAGNVFAVLVDYRSRRVIAAGGAFGFSAALLLYAVAPSWSLLLVASFAVGCASTAMIAASEVTLVDVAGDDAPSALSRAHLCGTLGDAIGPLALIAAATAGIGWRGVFAVAAVGMGVYAVWLATLSFPPPNPPPRSARGEDVLRDRRVWFYGVLALLLGPLDEPFVAFLIAHLERVRGLSPAAALAVALAWVGGLGLAYASSSRPGYRPVPHALPRFAALIATTATAIVVLPWPLLVAAIAAVFGFAVGRFVVALTARIVALRPGQVGTVRAVVTTIEFSGFLLPLAAGAVADAYGISVGLACYAVIAGTLLAQASRERAI